MAKVLSVIPLEAALAFRNDLRLGGHTSAFKRIHPSAHVGIVPIISADHDWRRKPFGGATATAIPPMMALAATLTAAMAARAVGVHDHELQAAVAVVACVAARGREARELEGPVVDVDVVVVVAAREPSVVPRHMDLLRHEDFAPAVRDQRPEYRDRGHDGGEVHLEGCEDDALRRVERRIRYGICACACLDDDV